MNFKDKRYYIEKTKEALGLILSGALFGTLLLLFLAFA